MIMNASKIINDDMTLEEKLAAIDAAVAKAQTEASTQAQAQGLPDALVDPASLTICEGCE